MTLILHCYFINYYLPISPNLHNDYEIIEIKL
jgi:hypothetical protein